MRCRLASILEQVCLPDGAGLTGWSCRLHASVLAQVRLMSHAVLQGSLHQWYMTRSCVSESPPFSVLLLPQCVQAFTQMPNNLRMVSSEC